MFSINPNHKLSKKAQKKIQQSQDFIENFVHPDNDLIFYGLDMEKREYKYKDPGSPSDRYNSIGGDIVFNKQGQVTEHFMTLSPGEESLNISVMFKGKKGFEKHFRAFNARINEFFDIVGPYYDGSDAKPVAEFIDSLPGVANSSKSTGVAFGLTDPWVEV